MENPVVFNPPNVENPVTDSELNNGSPPMVAIPAPLISASPVIVKSTTVRSVPTPVLKLIVPKVAIPEGF